MRWVVGTLIYFAVAIPVAILVGKWLKEEENGA